MAARPPQLSAQHLEQLTSMPRAKAFLGREFLTWLWYMAETDEAKLEIPARERQAARPFRIWVDDRLVLESGRGMSHENLLKGGDPARSHEAAAALACGKTVRELKLGLNIKGIGDFTAILSETDLNPRSLKLPVPDNDADQGQSSAATLPIAARLQQTELFLAALDTLFLMFIEKRVAGDFETEHLAPIREWIKKRQQSVLSGAAILH